MFDDQQLDDSPPPAYEVSQQELDRKISTAVEQSLTISQPARGADEGEDVWEEWDEAAFEVAAARSVSALAGSSSSPTESSNSSALSSAVPPLRIVKRKRLASASSATSEKHRLALSVQNQELEHEIPSYQESQSRPRPFVHPFLVHDVTAGEEGDMSPPFRDQHVGWSDTDSRIASPLSSPTLASSNQLSHTLRRPLSSPLTSMSPQPLSQTPPTFEPLTTPRRPLGRSSSRPSTSYTPSPRISTYGSMRVEFDPNVAYRKSSTFGKLPEDDEPVNGSVNAASLYKHAVAAHVTPSTPTPRKPSIAQVNRSSVAASMYGEPSSYFDSRNTPFTPNRPRNTSPHTMTPTSGHSSLPGSVPSPPRPNVVASNTQGLYAQPPTQRSSQLFQHPVPVTVAGPNRWAMTEHDITSDIYR
ncbi:hypothetical protein NEOLEDRAFT_1179164 [Neolentinus lepideus HHB14362 ss-1]|uniref:Uncharacterized protein n=1 Tax=Neolentinus lepideus HHB14362 ss-1 TaxID=1314782 RepID=A0A165RZR4_9AGAM|nr:hypothetical protein NEOLEDRAFT_1179164 [Neolentinus lepideus HHB14362 ss-1]